MIVINVIIGVSGSFSAAGAALTSCCLCCFCILLGTAQACSQTLPSEMIPVLIAVLGG